MGWSQNPLEAFPDVAVYIRHEMLLLAISFRDRLLGTVGRSLLLCANGLRKQPSHLVGLQ